MSAIALSGSTVPLRIRIVIRACQPTRSTSVTSPTVTSSTITTERGTTLSTSRELGGDLEGVVLVDRRAGQRQVVGALELAAREQHGRAEDEDSGAARERRRLTSHLRPGRRTCASSSVAYCCGHGPGRGVDLGQLGARLPPAWVSQSRVGTAWPSTGSRSCSNSVQASSLLARGQVGLLHDRAEQAVGVAERAVDADPRADGAGLVVEGHGQVAERERCDLERGVEALPLGVDGLDDPGQLLDVGDQRLRGCRGRTSSRCRRRGRRSSGRARARPAR